MKKLQARVGLIGGTDAGAMVLGDLVIDRVNTGHLTESGLGLLSGFVIDDDGKVGRIGDAIAANPAYVGLTIEPGTAVEVRGKDMRVIGEGTAKVWLAQGAGKDAQVTALQSGAQLDLIQLRREVASGAGQAKR